MRPAFPARNGTRSLQDTRTRHDASYALAELRRSLALEMVRSKHLPVARQSRDMEGAQRGKNPPQEARFGRTSGTGRLRILDRNTNTGTPPPSASTQRCGRHVAVIRSSSSLLERT